MIEILNWSKRHIIYSVLILIIFTVLTFIVNKIPDTIFIAASLTGYIVLLLELFVTSNHYHIKKRKNSNSEYYFEHHHNLQFMHHLGYPSLLYFTLTSILFFFHNPLLNIFIVLIATILFSLIFVNIHSFYNHDLSLTISTKYIYDLIGIILIFLGTLTFSEIYRTEVISSLFFYIFISLLYLYNFSLTALRNVYSSKSLIIGMFNAVILFFLTLALVEISSINLISISFLTAYIYQNYNYLIIQLNSKKFNKDTLIEYVIINVLILSIFYTATA